MIVSLLGIFFAFAFRPCLKREPSPCFYFIWILFAFIMILVQTMIIVLSHSLLKEINNKWFTPIAIFCLLAEAHALIPLKRDIEGNNGIELPVIISTRRLEFSEDSPPLYIEAVKQSQQSPPSYMEAVKQSQRVITITTFASGGPPGP